MPIIDLNADLAEGFGRWSLTEDLALLGVVSSANLACGFHAGDPTTLVRVCQAAKAAKVAIGAHVSYRDLHGFGRRFIDMAAADLCADVLYQVGALQAIAASVGAEVSYLKAHGALYWAMNSHPEQARAVAHAAQLLNLPILGLAGGSWLAHLDGLGVTCWAEGFADRGYAPAGTLIARGAPGAVHTEPEVAAAQAVRLGRGQLPEVSAEVQSICVHGDSPGAVALARAVRAALTADGFELRRVVP